jgi:hypothetical protein
MNGVEIKDAISALAERWFNPVDRKPIHNLTGNCRFDR